MDQNNQKKPDKSGGNRGGNLRGVVSLLCWALLLTALFSYAGS